MLFPEGGQQVETTPQGDDMGSCPSVSASICQAEVAQLHRLCFVADAALCHSHQGGKTRRKIEFTPGDQ